MLGFVRVVHRHTRREMLPFLPPFSCDELRSYLDEKEDVGGGAMLLLDCRSFLAYNEAHVVSAVNAYCPSILRRRARDKLPLHVLISSADIRDKVVKGQYAMVVLYEENSAPSVTAEDGHSSAIRVVSRCLQHDCGLRNVFYLDGGFQRFRQKHPQLCVGSQERPPCTGSPPRRGSSFTSSSPLLAVQPSSNPVYEQGDPVEILPHLFLGSAFHAANQRTLERLGITALLNVSRTCPNLSEGRFAYKCIPVDDSNSADISTWFSEAIEFIDDVKANDGKVLVHCHAGISRSATICLAYMMFTRRIRLDEAYEYVKTRRNIISPNFNFMGQLLKFESQLLLSSPAAAGSCCGGGGKSTPSSAACCCYFHHLPNRHHHHHGTPPPPLSGSPSSSSPPLSFATVVAAAAAARESCLLTAQRFVFDLGGAAAAAAEDCHYSPVKSSSSPLISPLCAAITPIMSPS